MPLKRHKTPLMSYQKNDTDKVGKPQFRMILTAVGGYAMQLEDGCIVVPIGCLKP